MSAIQALVQDEFSGDSIAALIKSLEAEEGDVQELIGHLREVQRRECGRLRARLMAGESISEDMEFNLGTFPRDLTVGWDTGSEVLSAMTEMVEVVGDHLFLSREDVAVP
ncbi:MAG TPA: hypothetical protein EYG38_02270, partial [Verrucomicrobia bacterium]|nr:hypothetical protein [Verrucomicrobiota bacterium]